MNLTADSVGNIQLAIDQLRGMGKLAQGGDAGRGDLAGRPAKAAAPDRVRI